MRKGHLILVIFVSLALLGLGSLHGSQTFLFDTKKCQRELEVMKGILQTTLEFVAKEFSGDDAGVKRGRFEWGPMLSSSDSITTFYLAGQGAVFTIPASAVRGPHRYGDRLKVAFGPESFDMGDFHFAMADLQAEMGDLNEQLEALGEQLGPEIVAKVQAANAHAVPAVPPAPPQPPNPPVPPPPPSQYRSEKDIKKVPGKEADLQKKLSDLQDKVKKRQEEIDSRKAKFRENLGQVKSVLIEALASHGDSLTTVKNNEYINLVFVDEGGGWLTDDPAGKREVISVQKSTIADYKAGKLTLEAFKQKVLDYFN